METLKKRQWIQKKRPASAFGICFEPLEPRLLLSGSWGAGMDSPAPDGLPGGENDFAQKAAAIYESAGTSGGGVQHQGQNLLGATAMVDILAQLPKLDEFGSGPVDPIPDDASTVDKTALATLDTLTKPLDDATGNGSSHTLQQESVTLAERRELVFVDTGISGYQQLVDDLLAIRGQGRDIEVIALDTGRDGIEQVSGVLAERSGLAAVHFITHASDGQIDLGNTGLNSATLEQNRAMVSRWGEALNETGDILFYGCNIAAYSAGQNLLNNIAELTGADVAASDDLTGHARLGGDWLLEFQKGEIETNVAFSPDAQQHWSGVLATFTVNTTNDTVDISPGNGLAQDASGNTSLRAAIMEANALGGADTISLAAGTYTLSRAGANESAASTGDLDITGNLTIAGAGAETTIIDGGGLDRVFETLAGATTITGVTVRNGSAGDGGGISVSGGGSLTLRDSAVSGNTATSTGGGILVSGTLTLDRVTVESNSADVGGGIYVGNGAISTFLNATLSGNSAASNGGAVYTHTAINITNSTIAYNTAAGAGGIHKQGSGTANIKNTILAYNTGGNSNGALNSLGNNIDSANTAGLSGPGDLIMTDPRLGALGYNGGPTKTHALLAGSPAINAGANLGAPAVDGRAFQRSDGRTDMGAFEAGAGLIEKVYWADQTNNKIQRANLDGSNVEDVLTSADGVNSPTGVLVDAENGKIYWSEFFAGNIRRANLDGTNIENLYSGLSSPAGMALDTANSKLYWTENPLFLGTNRIRCANMNGGGAIQNLVTTGTNDPVDMVLDLNAGKIYWTDGNSGEIRRANLDGTNAVVFLSGLAKPQGLELDLGARMMYWVSDGIGTNKIQRANMDGPIVVQDLVTTGLDSPIGIELDLATGRIYWSDWGTRKIQTANLDGSNVQNLVSSGLGMPIGIALGPGGNGAPALNSAASPAFAAENEDAGPPAGAVGTLVSSLVDFLGGGGLDNVTDPDAGATLGIAVTGANTTNGSWWYSTNNGSTWNALGAVTNNNARLLAADATTRLYFQPNANYNGNIADAITFRAWDRTSGSNGALATTATSGGTSAFSAATDAASLTVSAVNDAPTITTIANQTTPEDTPTAALAFTVGDVETAAASLTVTASSSNTTLIPNANLVLGGSGANRTITVTPAANQNGGPATITLTVSDGTTSTSTTFNVTVNAVNDAPVLDNTKSPALTAQNEDAGAPSGAVGTLVSALVDFARPPGRWTTSRDVDSGALLGIAVTAADTANGSLVVLHQQWCELERPGGGRQ